MTAPRPTWDDFFLSIAEAVSARGDCTRRRVGAVIVDESHRVVSIGYNGAPPGRPGCLTDGACPRGRLSQDERASGTGDYDHCVAVHAEANALIYADPLRLPGATLYVTEEPCPGCRKLIDGALIESVVVGRPGKLQVVVGDDWGGIYRDGQLVTEGHTDWLHQHALELAGVDRDWSDELQGILSKDGWCPKSWPPVPTREEE